jgi:hypothetical protein
MPTIILPPPLQLAYDSFMNFYSSKYQGRRLVWQHSLGQCIMKMNLESKNNKRHELDVTTFQAMVLYCFNIPNNDQLVKEKSGSSHNKSTSSPSSFGDMNDDLNGGEDEEESSSSSSSSSSPTDKSLPTSKLSFMEIQKSTGIETEELKRTLQSLACGKVQCYVRMCW